MSQDAGPLDLQGALRVLRERRAHLREKCLVDVVGVFGSLARGDARPDSDVDVLADFLSGTTLFRISEAQFELEAAMGRSIDLVDRKGLRDFVRPGVERDFIAL